jgi:hypothetical protein
VPDSWLATEKPELLIGLRVPISWRTTEKSAIKGGCHLPRQTNLPFKFVYLPKFVPKGNAYMDKKQAISIISKCAKTYKKYLDGYQVVFVYRDGNNKSDYTEVQFRSHNFLHFTGVTPRQGLNANNFYRFALNSQISEGDFSFKHNHTTELKLNVLDTIMKIDTSARMIGNYTGPHLELYTEKVTGTTTACLGLVQANNCYVPNSVLSEDIRSIVPKPPGKIYAIFKKTIGSPIYTQLTYKSKDISITKKCLPKGLLSQIEPSLLEEPSQTTNSTTNT